jgi:hypothetical protein
VSATSEGDGPFSRYAAPGTGRTALYRCLVGSGHFFSTDPGCEGQTTESLLGYLSDTRSSSTPRPFTRCDDQVSGAHGHWLAEDCPAEANVVGEGTLGFVR